MSIEVSTRSYTLRIQVLGPGEAFGWSALLDHHDTLFQVPAREHSKALCFDGSKLSDALRDDPVLAAELLRRTLKLVAGRVQAIEAKLGGLCGLRMRKDT